MSDFINTIEALGDDAVVDSIINRTITEFKDDTIETIGNHAFYGCADLTYVSMPNANTLQSYAFENCSALIDFDLPLVEKFNYYSFNKCTSLTTALTEENLPSATVLNSPFNGCTSIEVIDLPKVTTCTGEFGGKNSKLISVNLPNAVHTQNNKLTFAFSPNLETVLVPKLTQIGEYGQGVLQYCGKLTNTDFSSLEEVGLAAFSNCGKLRILDFPKVNSIRGFQNFEHNYELIALILRNPDTVCTLANSNAFGRTPIESGTGYIYVPRALLSDDDETKDYRRATNWSTFAAQFRALEDCTVDGTVNGKLKSGNISYNLHGVTLSNKETFVIASYETSIQVPTGYEIAECTVTMDGVDITDSVYANNSISIPEIIGDVVITVKSNIDEDICLLPAYGSETGDIPRYKLEVKAGQTIRLRYYLTAYYGYLYDGRGCGLNYKKGGNTINAEKTLDIAIPSDGYIMFSDHYNATGANGDIADAWNDRLVGKYLFISIL